MYLFKVFDVILYIDKYYMFCMLYMWIIVFFFFFLVVDFFEVN